MSSRSIKNPVRPTQSFQQKAYVPNYKRLNMEPILRNEEVTDDLEDVVIAPPRVSRLGGAGFPNSGNHKEQLWMGVDDEQAGDEEVFIEQKPNRNVQVISGYSSTSTLNIPFNHNVKHTSGFLHPQGPAMPQTPVEQVVESQPTLSVGEFILMILEEIVCIGSEEDIKVKITDILSGKNEVYNADVITADDFIVLKRVPVSVGVLIG